MAASRVESPLEGQRFEALYRAQSRGILLFFVSRVLEPELALDLTAETFAQAITSRRGFKGTTDDEAMAWIYGIARNQLARYFRTGQAESRALRKLRLEVPHLDRDESAQIEREAGLIELRAALRDALESVSPEQRDALRLRLVDELAYADVAARLGISEGSARARVSRGLKALNSYFDTHPLPEEAT